MYHPKVTRLHPAFPPKPKQWAFSRDVGGGQQVMLCPFCGGEYTHHRFVVSWFRDTEDAKKGIYALVGTGQAVLSNEMEGNPSDRRDGFYVNFKCENCAADWELTFEQNRGQTFVRLG